MPHQTLAIALCRVSSPEQVENNSLNRQEQAVRKAAEELGAIIPENYWWSGNVSSKRGTNLNRKDLKWVMNICKKDKRVKYVIVDEPDRFMRSIDEAAYFEVAFREINVKVWYASDPELNKGDLASKLLKFTKYLSAEGSNEERQRKSIAGQNTALREGRYPFIPKPGYKRGYERGIHEVDPILGPILRSILIKIATHRVTPSVGLQELNKSKFMNDHSVYKMDKFRKIITDPYYAGIVEINKQVSVRNENGLHKPLIAKDQHYQILEIMNGKKKVQSGPRKNGNPKYPLNNIIQCDLCVNKKNNRLVGLDLTNGKENSKTYEKYRCRSCKKYFERAQVHTQIEQLFKQYELTPEGIDVLLDALAQVWKQEEKQAAQEANRLQNHINTLNLSISRQIEALTDPNNFTIQNELRISIELKKHDIADLEEKFASITYSSQNDREDFLKFALKFTQELGSQFLVINPENRLRCKQIIFPAGFRVNEKKKVYTPEVSTLYRLAAKKMDAEASEDSHLVPDSRRISNR